MMPTATDRMIVYVNSVVEKPSNAKPFVNRSILNMLGWESLHLTRCKSIYMYKIINDHAAPNLKQLFRRCNEGDSPYELRNRETDLILSKPKKEFLKRSLKYNGAITIGIIYPY